MDKGEGRMRICEVLLRSLITGHSLERARHVQVAEEEAAGWNAVVKPGLSAADVERTSNTRVTITLPAFGAYSVSGLAAVTATVPASAVTSNASPISVSGSRSIIHDGESI